MTIALGKLSSDGYTSRWYVETLRLSAGNGSCVLRIRQEGGHDSSRMLGTRKWATMSRNDVEELLAELEFLPLTISQTITKLNWPYPPSPPPPSPPIDLMRGRIDGTGKARSGGNANAGTDGGSATPAQREATRVAPRTLRPRGNSWRTAKNSGWARVLKLWKCKITGMVISGELHKLNQQRDMMLQEAADALRGSDAADGTQV